MAAVLCQGIGQACAGLGDVLGAVLCFPCRLCGCACQGIGDLLSSPFFPYSALTFGLNVPPIVLGIKGMMLTDCASIDKWFLVNAIFCLVHCLACLYIIHRIQHDPFFSEDPVVTATPVSYAEDAKKKSFTASVFGAKSDAAPSAPSDSKKSFAASVFGSKTDESKIESGTYYAQPVEATPFKASPVKASPVITKSSNKSIANTQSNSLGRIKHVLCYDGGVAIYIILAIVWMVWLAMGLGRLTGFNAGACGGSAVAGKLFTSLICGYIYLSLVGIGFLCSLCCLR